VIFFSQCTSLAEALRRQINNNKNAWQLEEIKRCCCIFSCYYSAKNNTVLCTGTSIRPSARQTRRSQFFFFPSLHQYRYLVLSIYKSRTLPAKIVNHATVSCISLVLCLGQYLYTVQSLLRSISKCSIYSTSSPWVEYLQETSLSDKMKGM